MSTETWWIVIVILAFLIGLKCGTYLQFWYVQEGERKYHAWRKRRGFE